MRSVSRDYLRSFKHVVDRRDWTSDKSVDDTIGHGTFVASQVGGRNARCMGVAPEAQLHIYRLFTSYRVSFTSWFLDAFNFAMHAGVDVLNLSIGGPDFLDQPFTEKVREVTAHGIILTSAIGNDGPAYGTLNNPADMNSVIGVGGMGHRENLASFSSRGMTTWELPQVCSVGPPTPVTTRSHPFPSSKGYGRVKPDVVTFSAQLRGANMEGGCMDQSGTSMSSPVVAGAVAVILSSISQQQRRRVVNPASVKQVLLESAIRIDGANVFEQGAGRVNLAGAVEVTTPRVLLLALFFASLLTRWSADATLRTSCVLSSSLPGHHRVSLLLAVLRAAHLLLIHAATLQCDGAQWVCCHWTLWCGRGTASRGGYGAVLLTLFSLAAAMPTWVAGRNGEHLVLSFEMSKYVWPWTGHLGVRISVAESGKRFEVSFPCRLFQSLTLLQGTAEGVIQVELVSPHGKRGKAQLPFRVSIVPTPPRARRLLWDQVRLFVCTRVAVAAAECFFAVP